jgi:hypothetical protein
MSVWPECHYIALLICYLVIQNKASWNVRAEVTMCGEVLSNQDGSRLTRRVVDIMGKWDTIGRINISVQNKIVDRLD